MPEGNLIVRPQTLPQGYFRVVAAYDPMRVSVKLEALFQQGLTIEDVLKKIQPDPELRDHSVVFIEDQLIYSEMYHLVRPKAGANVYIRVQMGVSGIIAIVGAVAGAAVKSALVSAGVSALVASIAGALVSTAISFVGSALFSPDAPSSAISVGRTSFDERESPTFSITQARNESRQFQPVPVVLGTHKFVPPYGAEPYTEIVGNDQYLRFIVVWGYGPVEVSDIRIGNTPIGSFEDVEQEDDFAGTLNSLTLYPDNASQENLSITLTDTFQTRNTDGEVDEFGITLAWPRGLNTINNSGNRVNNSMSVIGEYRLVGDSAWVSWFDETYTDDTAEVKRVAKRVTGITRGEYEIRLKRGEAESDDTSDSERVLWGALRSFRNEDPIQLDGVAKSAFRIRATDQLNGVVDELNGVVSLKIPVWQGDSAGWGGEQITSNPAAIFRYLLLGAPNKRALLTSQVDDINLGEWYEFCESEGLTYDSVIDYRASVRSLMNDVSAAGKASPHLVDDAWGVIIEKPRSTITQHFTPRNSSNFSAQVLYTEIPEGFRVRFFNKDKGYREDERIVYDDGFDESNATKFQLLELPGITDPDNVYKLARTYLAAVRLRPEVFTFETDIENLVATRGDLIRLSHDVPQIGQTFGRVKSISGSDLTLDEEVTMEASLSYSVRIRKTDGGSKLVSVTNDPGTTKTITVSDVTGITAGDIFQFGQTGEESVELVIRDIEPGDDLSASLTCVPYQPAIYSAADVIPPYTSSLSDPVSRSFVGPPTPQITNVISNESALQETTEGALNPAILVYFQPGAAAASNDGTVTRTVQFRARFRRSGTNDPFKYMPLIDTDSKFVLLEPVQTGQGYNIQLQAIGPNGEVSNYATVSNHIVLGATEKPAQVNTFSINTVGDHTYVEWTYADIPVDVIGYEIRYHPDQNITDWGTMLVIADEVPRAARSFTVPSRSGSYAIKAIDILNNRSEAATFVNATLEDPEALNVVQTFTEEPSFTGTKTDTAVVNGALQLESASVMADWTTLADVSFLTYGTGQGVELEGFYEFGEVDLGNIYTSRLTADIVISSLNFLNTMSTWSSLSELDSLSGNTSGDNYGVEIQVAYDMTNDSAPTYSAYQRFAVGDYTARRFKFRAKLTSLINEITPIITALSVSVDMPDRVEDGDDVATGGTTLTVDFSPHFRELRSVTINGQDMNSGDYWRVTNKNAESFDITFYDSTDTVIDRTFDWQAIGYGRVRGT